MDKVLLTWLCSLGVCAGFAFEKLDPKYLISYGNPNSSIKIVEHFSMSCTKCFDCFQEDFKPIKSKYIDNGEVFWVFHPDPTDLLTLQAMVCLEHLRDDQKPLFFETVLKHVKEKKHKHGCIVMQAVMEVLGRPLPDLAEMEFLEKTDAFQDAFLFLKQKDVIKAIPMVEINGKLREEYPTREFLEREISFLRKKAL
jgi:hypothetical protein